MNSSTILDLFRQTGIQKPTDIQTQNVVHLLNRTIIDKQAFLKAGIETAEGLKRWRGLELEMKTIDTVGDHQKRVNDMLLMCSNGITAIGAEFDFRRASFMAKNHDMTEGLSPYGDIPTPLKLSLPPTSLILLKEVELACLEILSTMDSGEYQMNSDEIKETLLEMENKKTPEAQMVKYFDLLDAYMMSIHEYGIGTTEFLSRVEWYRAAFQKIHTGKYLPFLQKLQASLSHSLENQLCHTPALHLLDIGTLSQLELDPKILIHGAAYNFWKVHIARV